MYCPVLCKVIRREYMGARAALSIRLGSFLSRPSRIHAPRPLGLERYADDPIRMRRELGAWISQRDHQQLFIRSIETPDIEDEYGVPFQIFYGVSNNARRFWSIVNARRAIGYAPQDDSEVEYADEIARFLTPRERR